MSQIISLHCDICQEDRALDRYLFSPCGHGYCDVCTRSLEKTKLCPSCRKPRSNAKLHKIFVTLAEPPVEAQVQSLTSSMNKLRPNSEPALAEEIVKGIKKVTGKLQVDTEMANKLLKVADDMQDRLLPIFFIMRLEQDEKRALQEKVNLWQPRVTQVEASAAQLTNVNKQLEKVKRDYHKLAAQLLAERNENEKLRKDIIDERRITKEKEELVQRLREEKENVSKEAKVAKTKLRALASTTASLSNRRVTSKGEDDSSLLVESNLICL